MRNRILKWLFGTDNIETYMRVLEISIDTTEKYQKSLDAHLETLNNEREDIALARKLLIICENHGIDVDKEIKEVKLLDE